MIKALRMKSAVCRCPSASVINSAHTRQLGCPLRMACRARPCVTRDPEVRRTINNVYVHLQSPLHRTSAGDNWTKGIGTNFGRHQSGRNYWDELNHRPVRSRKKTRWSFRAPMILFRSSIKRWFRDALMCSWTLVWPTNTSSFVVASL